MNDAKKRNPWAWVPSLYFAEGLPYVVVVIVSVIMYKNLGLTNEQIGLYTSWLYLPWVIKPFWSPFVDVVKTKRYWIILMQLVLGVGLAGVAFTLPTDNFVQYTLAFMWLLAFSSATHDIAIDGFYMIGLREEQQSFFVGIRSFFYRVAILAGQGLLVVLAGNLETFYGGDIPGIKKAWAICMAGLGVFMIISMLYHAWILPRIEEEQPSRSFKEILAETWSVMVKFFRKKQILLILAFILFYRLGEAQLSKMAAPFMLDDAAAGGLGLETATVGQIYGTIGVIGLVVGGILGGILASRDGLKKWFWWMIAAINLPNAVYIYLAYAQPDSFAVISSCVAVEQFGYGFGFTAFMLYLIYVAQGEHKTSHFAFGTGLMALGMMVPGMFSGYIQESLGYLNFFIWVLIATIPAFVLAAFIPLDPEFGKKKD